MNVMAPIDLASNDATEQQCPAVALELREVRAFLCVARNGNFGRAARELKLSQPTLSHQVQRLEEVVGQSLLLRHRRGATLTPAGTALLGRLEAISRLLDVPLALPDMRSGVAGTLSLGLPPELAPVLLPKLVASLHECWPQLRLELRESSAAALEAAALAGCIDVAILQDPAELDSLETTTVLTEPLGLVAGFRSQLAQERRALRLRDLADVPLILPDEQHWIRRKLESAAFQHGLRLSPRLQVGSLAALKAVIGNGLGGAVLPQSAVQDELARGSLVFRPIGSPALVCTHAVTLSRGAGAAAAALARLTQRVMAGLVKDGVWSGAMVCAAASPDRAALAEPIPPSGRVPAVGPAPSRMSNTETGRRAMAG